MTVTVQSVRDLLDNVAASHLTSAAVQANIDRWKRIVDNVKEAGAAIAEVEDAIRAGAVWLSYGTYVEGINQTMGAIAVADKIKLDDIGTAQQKIDIANYRQSLRDLPASTDIQIDNLISVPALELYNPTWPIKPK